MNMHLDKKKLIYASTIPQSLDTFWRGFLRQQAKDNIVVALSSPGESMPRIAEREGVKTIEVPMERRISLRNDLVSLWNLVKVFRRERPYMVHSMTPKAGLLCMMAAWLTRVPVRVHTFTGLVFPTSTGLKRMVLMTTDRITCFCATHIIPEGEGVKRDLLENRITRKPIRVLGYGNVRGVDMAYYSRRPEVMQIADTLRDKSRFTYLFVGRIVRDKGIDELVTAFTELHNRHPNARLILVGSYEDGIDPVSQTSKSAINSHPAISAVGVKTGDELLAYYVASDCFVLPSYREGFPNTVMEAGALGIPCVVTDINGSNEIIRNAENGLIVPPKNAAALRKAMEKMIVCREDTSLMASNARKMIADRFEQSFVRQCLIDFYKEIFK